MPEAEMNHRSRDRAGQRSSGITSTLTIYCCAVGAAATVTIFDGIQNEKSAALMKAGGWFSRVFSGGDQGAIWFVLALLFFCLFAALVALAYRPQDAKEAFLLGAGVLAMLNAMVRPPTAPERQAAASFLISSAHAQPAPVASPPAATEVWIATDGPQAFKALDTRLVVYAADNGRAVFNSNIRLIDAVLLPPGSYYFELSHPGFRGVVFKAEVAGASSAFNPALEQASLDGLVNLFGPRTIKLRPDEAAGSKLSLAKMQCAAGNAAASVQMLKTLPRAIRQRLEQDPMSRQSLCAPRHL